MHNTHTNIQNKITVSANTLPKLYILFNETYNLDKK